MNEEEIKMFNSLCGKCQKKFKPKSKTKEFKPKIKEKWRKDCTIKLQTLLEVTENPKNCFSNDEKLINVSIDKGLARTSTSFPTTKKGKKELLKYIKEGCYL